jgi:hypothetical protein
MRSLFNRAFTAAAVERLKTRVATLVDNLLAPVAQGGEIELISEFAYPLPAMVICDMLGVGHDELWQLESWSKDIAMFIGLPVKPRETYVQAARSNAAMSDYFREVVSQRKRAPRDDLISALLAVNEGGDRLTEDELVATCVLLLFAAHTTTTHLLGNGVLALTRWPGELARLRQHPEVVGAAVEELLRYDGPVQAVRRRATSEVMLGGKRLAAGDLVFLMLNAANRDPERFADPERLSIERADNRHIAFGHGIHFCPGAPLARLEAKIALHALLQFPAWEVATDEPLEWLSAFGFRGLVALPLRLARPREGHS